MPVGRFAPSPSGPLHVGNLRTALVAWLFARSAGSRFLMRVEDLDPGATREEHVGGQLADIEALGLTWDGPVLRQSTRSDRYREVIEQLRTADLLYPCYCTRREVRDAAQAPHGEAPEGAYRGTCRELTAAERAEREARGRQPAMRLRAGEERIDFEDRLAGPYEGFVDDFVVVRRDGGAAYNLAVVVDDADQGIEEVVRGDDLLAGTTRHIHIAHLLGLAVPRYAHVPLVLGPSGERLAKRDGAVTLADRIDLGETPAQVLGVLASSIGIDGLGAEVEAPDLIDRFDPDRIPRAPWVFDPT